jgi:hypothetical protein
MGFRKSEPKYRLKFEVSEKHCETAVRKDPCRCVIAQAMYDKFGDALASIHVLPTRTTLVYNDGRIRIYRTPRVLREGLKSFDETGEWHLAAGTYYLLPRKKSNQAAFERERAKRRVAAGDPHKLIRKPAQGKAPRARKLDPRMITLRTMKVGVK